VNVSIGFANGEVPSVLLFLFNFFHRAGKPLTIVHNDLICRNTVDSQNLSPV
jgi:hypothetical protein